MKIKINELSAFLYKASQFGYATGRYKDWVKEEDSSTTIYYKDDNWKMSDNFFGGEPFGGRTVVFYKNKPVWVMVYYGFIKEDVNQPIEKVYKFLQSALSMVPKEFPLRGPKEYTKNNFVYQNTWKGEISQYFGKEKILLEGNLIYRAYYLGGLVNLRSG